MKTQKQAKQVKQVQVLTIYRFKNIARICFVVESSNGKDTYNTCFNRDAEHGSCTCRGGDFHNCYHLDQLKARAAEYFAARQPAQPVQPEKANPVQEAQAFIAKARAAKTRQQEDWSSPDAPIYGPVAQKLHNSNEGHFEKHGDRLIPMR